MKKKPKSRRIRGRGINLRGLHGKGKLEEEN